MIGAVFLALTGGEALYADMGHVGRPAIRRAWFGLVLPALVLNYFGQGALMLGRSEGGRQPVLQLGAGLGADPDGGAGGAGDLIASQALISGVFSLTRQAMQMGLCPRAKIVPTSSDEAGQIYVPTANWLLMAGTLLIVVMFKTSDTSLPPTASPCPAPCWSPRSCSIAWPCSAGAGRRLSLSRSSRCSAPSRRFSWCPIRSRSSKAAGFR